VHSCGSNPCFGSPSRYIPHALSRGTRSGITLAVAGESLSGSLFRFFPFTPPSSDVPYPLLEGQSLHHNLLYIATRTRRVLSKAARPHHPVTVPLHPAGHGTDSYARRARRTSYRNATASFPGRRKGHCPPPLLLRGRPPSLPHRRNVDLEYLRARPLPPREAMRARWSLSVIDSE
jgi:hypothetical protein